MPLGDAPHFAEFLDLEVLQATAGGRERTEAEDAALLAGAGLRLQRVVPLASGSSVVEAVAAVGAGGSAAT